MLILKKYNTDSEVIVSKASIERFIEQYESPVSEEIYSEADNFIIWESQ
jgi:hypothetical protein